MFATALAIAAACSDPRAGSPVPEGKAASPAPEAVVGDAQGARADATEAAASPPDAGAAATTDALARRLAESAPVGARLISPRSLSIKVALASGDRAVWKPLRKTNRTARYEVAFSKLAPLVGAPRVPLSVLRRLSVSRLAGLLEAGSPEMAQALRDEALADENGLAGGAIIEWVADLGPPLFEGESGWKQLARWLGRDGPLAGDEPMVAAASRMVVADYVLGNWDRFSGGNLFADASGRGLALVDNNGSFAPWSQRQHERMDGQLAACARFSASQIEQLRALDKGAVRAALAVEEARGVVDRVLTDAEIALLLERRDSVLHMVDAEVAARGTKAVIAFP